MSAESRTPRSAKKAAPSAPSLASDAPPAIGGGTASTGNAGASGREGGASGSTPASCTRKHGRSRRHAGRASAKRGADDSTTGEFGHESTLPSVEGTSIPETPARIALDLLRAGESELRVRAVLTHRNLAAPVIDDAIEQAYAQMRASWTERGAREKMALALEQRARIVAEAMASSDWRVALSAMEQREKLLGLTGPDALEQAATNLLELLRLATETGNLTDSAD